LVKASPVPDPETQKGPWGTPKNGMPHGPDNCGDTGLPLHRISGYDQTCGSGRETGNPNAGNTQEVYDGGVQPTALRQFSRND